MANSLSVDVISTEREENPSLRLTQPQVGAGAVFLFVPRAKFAAAFCTRVVATEVVIISATAMQSIKQHVAAQVLFLFLAALLCGNLLLNPANLPVGAPVADSAQTQWNLWWIARVLGGGTSESEGILYTEQLFHPVGSSLAWHTIELLPGLITLPCRALLGAAFQHSAALFIATWLTAWGMFLLVRALGGTALAATITSVVIALHGYRLAEAHHLNIFNTQFLPFTLWLLLLLHRSATGEARFHWVKCGIGLGVVAIAALLTSLFHALACGIAVLVMMPAIVYTLRTMPAALLRVMGGCAIAFGLSVPVLLWWVANWNAAGAPVSFGSDTMASSAADLWQYILHPRLRIMFFTGQELPPGMWERSVTWYLPGYTVMAIPIVGWFVMRGSHPAKKDSEPAVRPVPRIMWIAILVLALVYTLLSLGPLLKVGHPGDINPKPTGIGLPAAWLHGKPVLGTMRSVWHFGFCGTMCFAAIAVLPIGGLMTRLREPRHRRMAMIGLPLLAGLEIFTGPISTGPEATDGMALYIQQHTNTDDAIVVLPQALYELRGYYMFQQTIHERPIMGGYLSRDPQGFDAWMKERKWPVELELVGYGRQVRLSDDAETMLRKDLEQHNFAWLQVVDPSESQNFTASVVRELARLKMGSVVYTEGACTLHELARAGSE